MKMTSKRADIVRALKSGPAEYLMIRPMASVPELGGGMPQTV